MVSQDEIPRANYTVEFITSHLLPLISHSFNSFSSDCGITAEVGYSGSSRTVMVYYQKRDIRLQHAR